MKSTAIRSISRAAHVIGTLVFLLALGSMVPALLALVPHSLVVTMALVLLIVAGALTALYLALFAQGALHQPVSVGRFVPEAWESILTSVLVAGVAWIHLSEVVNPGSRVLRLAPVVLIVLAVGLLLHRVYHLRVKRQGHSRVQPDVGSQ
jgi:hypothetical protein